MYNVQSFLLCGKIRKMWKSCSKACVEKLKWMLFCEKGLKENDSVWIQVGRAAGHNLTPIITNHDDFDDYDDHDAFL